MVVKGPTEEAQKSSVEHRKTSESKSSVGPSKEKEQEGPSARNSPEFSEKLFDAAVYTLSEKPRIDLSLELVSKLSIQAPVSSHNLNLSRSRVSQVREVYEKRDKRLIRSYADFLALPRQEKNKRIISLPDMSEYMMLTNIRPKDNDYRVSLMLLRMGGGLRTNYAAKYLMDCMSSDVVDQKIQSMSLGIDHDLRHRILKEVSVARDVVAHMDEVTDVISKLHYSMRTLVKNEAVVKGARSIDDYSSQLSLLASPIKGISMNIIQSLNARGRVWIPMDIYFGEPGTENEKLHFLIVQLIKDREGRIYLSVFETNGVFDVARMKTMEREPTKKYKTEVFYKSTYAQPLIMGSVNDFSGNPGICNAGAIERMIHPATRLMNHTENLQKALTCVMESIAKNYPEGSGQIFFNPPQLKHPPQAGNSCHLTCIQSALENNEDMSMVARRFVDLCALDKATIVLANEDVDSQRNNMSRKEYVERKMIQRSGSFVIDEMKSSIIEEIKESI